MLCNVSDNCVSVLIEQAAKNKKCFLTLLFWDSFDGWDHVLKPNVNCVTLAAGCSAPQV